MAPDVEARVRELRRQTIELHRKADPEAIKVIRTAWELSKDVADLCSLGELQLELGRERDAAATLSNCLRMFPAPEADPLAVPWRKALERSLKLARAVVGALEIEANVAGAEVLIDGELVGKLPLLDPIFVDPGWRKVEVRAPGFRADSKKVEAWAGGELRLKMQLAEIQPEVVSEGRERPTPGAPATPVPKTTILNTERSSGPHSAAAHVKEPPGAWPLPVGIALGLVGTGLGVGGFVAAKSAHDEADAMDRNLLGTGDDFPCRVRENHAACKELVDTGDRIVPFTALGIGGLVVAGAGGALIIYEFVRAGSTGAKDSARVAATVTPGGGALWLGGSF